MVKAKNYQSEIFYHVFQRSFFDSNGDQHGDLNGLRIKLDYLQDLGITSILLVPLCESPFYHNYFPNDFREIDSKYGLLEDFQLLVHEVHERDMKIYLDMEIHYVAEDHIWFKESFRNPESVFSDFIIYNEHGNEEPESIIYDLKILESYDGRQKKVTTVNLYYPEVKKYIFEEFKFWTDPLSDGSLKYGVDGFRIDHMMDDLDSKGKIVNIFDRFWKPLFKEIRQINPDITFMGEQADWESYGRNYFILADIDLMFAFPLKFAIESFDKSRIQKAINDYLYYTPAYKEQLVFIENHDTDRYATTIAQHSEKLRIGAAFNIFLIGVPIIYYGQELGMLGKGGFEAYGKSDGNDIPRREAFRWNSVVETPGTCLWYKNSGPWWDESSLSDHDGISVEEQQSNSQSLLNFYKNAIAIHKQINLETRWLEIVENDNSCVISFLRRAKSRDKLLLVNINLSNENQTINIDTSSIKGYNVELLVSYPTGQSQDFAEEIILHPYALNITMLTNKLLAFK